MDTKNVMMSRRQKREYNAPNSARGFGAGVAGVGVGVAGGLVVGRSGVSSSDSGSSWSGAMRMGVCGRGGGGGRGAVTGSGKPGGAPGGRAVTVAGVPNASAASGRLRSTDAGAGAGDTGGAGGATGACCRSWRARSADWTDQMSIRKRR